MTLGRALLIIVIGVAVWSVSLFVPWPFTIGAGFVGGCIIGLGLGQLDNLRRRRARP
jgi:hypothetical protein